MSRWALVPVKGFDRGKSRLSEVLNPGERAELTRALFEHVVRVLQDAPSIDDIAVVSDSTEARTHAQRLGLVAIEDTKGNHGLADIVDAALDELEARGAMSAMICMSDLPELEVDDVESVARTLDESDVVLAPDLMNQGTNVVATKPATALPSCLGHADSLQRHRQRARELGLNVSMQLRAGIGFDVDRPRDLVRLQRR